VLKRYEKFLKSFDERLENYFEQQCEFIKCREGCSTCCEVGEYPFSRLEAEYLMSGFINLPQITQQEIKKQIRNLKSNSQKMYKCPFLIDKKCSLYKYRGIICRVHGLAWFDGEKVQLPYCVNKGLNYAKVFDRETGEVFLPDVIKEPLRINSILRSPEAEELELECGEIRPLKDWF
jgi:hypothetical protein